MSEKLIRYFKLIGTIILFMSVVFGISKLRGCFEQKSTTTITKKYDSSVVTVQSIPVYTGITISQKPIIKYRDRWLPVSSDQIVVDTQAIISAWLHNTYYYTDTTRSDTSLWLAICDSVRQNEIFSRKISYKILRPTSIITILPKPQNKLKILAGGSIGLGYSGLGVKPALLIINKHEQAFTIETNILQPQPNISFGTYFKIW